MSTVEAAHAMCPACGGDGGLTDRMWRIHKPRVSREESRCTMCGGDGIASCDVCGEHAMKAWTLVRNFEAFYYCSPQCQDEDRHDG